MLTPNLHLSHFFVEIGPHSSTVFSILQPFMLRHSAKVNHEFQKRKAFDFPTANQVISFLHEPIKL